MLCKHLNVLGDQEVDLRKIDLLCRLCKNYKIWYKNKAFCNVFYIFCTTHKNVHF
jgi:hypothetical protein